MGKKKSTPASLAAASRKREPQRKPAAPLKKSAGSAPVEISGSQFKSDASEERAEAKLSGSIAFPIVGIGASTGGLEAFTQLLEHLLADTGMAYVLVQHLAPKHESMLTELLSRATSMPVNEVIDGTTVEPNHVYVIPPNTDMAILQGVLRLLPRLEGHGQQHMPIDHFLRSLAEDQKSRAIGVILSGTASDGALGLKAIKAESGITFAQDEATAKYHGMPRSAIAAGYVDFILPPAAIAQELARTGRHPYVNRFKPEGLGELSEDESNFNKILALVRSATGVDFTYYKPTTIKRRIARRMVLHRIDDLKNYIKYLQTDTKEVAALYNDILINVTGFFRDQETFQFLLEKVFPVIME
ncbi:MAG: chemotaxis protein CheB, partial [bacterium]